jgi:serine/threonine protein kinase
MGSLDVTPGTWALLDHLLDQALDLPEAERERWMRRLAPEHAEKLRALLARAGAAEPVDTPRPETPPVLPAPPRDIGPYHLIRLLGEGGMGAVWLAERKDLMIRRPVALKLPRASWHGTALARRLAREREILATLSHPNIAKLLDAGIAADGHPYLALEYVEGRPIDVHAREHELSIRDRLALFRQVLAAVAHAHGRLVVHRDLKPSNVLVTADGQVRLLDFGIAKLVAGNDTPATELTQIAGPVFTPNYASPEQLAGQPIGVASDIYSLGILLYELLAQVEPYRLRRELSVPLHEALRAQTIVRPSEAAPEPLRKALAGDLDTIVLKAMKPSPDERYSTADAFADDIGRFLDGYPIQARPDSPADRLRKLVLRHRAAAAAIVAIVLAVIGGSSLALWQARRATAEQVHAEAVTAYLTGLLRDASPYGTPGPSISTVDMLKRAHAELDRIGARPALRVELLDILGSVLLDFGDNDAAEQVASQALSEAERGLAPDDPQRLRARLLTTDVQLARGRDGEMRDEIDQLVTLLEAPAREQPADVVRALANRSQLAAHELRWADAQRDARRAFDLALARFGDRDSRTVNTTVLIARSYQLDPRRDRDAALREAERWLQFALHAYDNLSTHPHVISAREVLARALCFAGQPDRALVEFDRALHDAREALGPSRPLIGQISLNRALCERPVGYLTQALEDGTRGLELRNDAMQRDSRQWGNAHRQRGLTLLAARRPKEALDDLSAAADSLGRALGPRHWLTLLTRAHRMVALAYVGRTQEALDEIDALAATRTDTDAAELDAAAGTVHRITGYPAAARDELRRALEHLPANPDGRFQRLSILVELGQAEADLGLVREAEASLTEALALSATEQRVDNPVRADAWVGLARVRAARQRDAEAVVLLERADAFWRGFDAVNPAGAEAAILLARYQRQLGHRAEAERTEARARQLRPASPASTAAPRATD